MVHPDQLTDDGFEYYALDGVCGVFHPAMWWGLYMAHYGVLPSAWGRTTEPGKAILRQFWEDRQPEKIIGWTDSRNRAALSYARRLGFREYARLKLSESTIVQQEWTPWQ